MGRQLLLTNFLPGLVQCKIGYCSLLDLVLYWILFFIGHCSLLDLVLYWILFFIGSLGKYFSNSEFTVWMENCCFCTQSSTL